jgi:hypothetical protein
VHILHIPLCVTLIYDSYSTLSLLQQRDGLTVGLLVNHAVTVEGFAALFVAGEGTDKVRVLYLSYIFPEKALLAELFTVVKRHPTKQ